MQTILLVDYDPEFIEAYGREMKSEGFTTIGANDFETAKTLFEQKKGDFAAITLTAALGKYPPFDPYPFAKYVREAGFTGVVIGSSNSRSHVNKMEQDIHFTDECWRMLTPLCSRTLQLLQKFAV